VNSSGKLGTVQYKRYAEKYLLPEQFDEVGIGFSNAPFPSPRTPNTAEQGRHTASGISWKFRPTSTNRNAAYPLRLSVAKIAVAPGSAVSVNVWIRRDSTNIKGKLVVYAGQLPGLESEVSVACEPGINTWTLTSLKTWPTFGRGWANRIANNLMGV
jgi:hypothetical protein